VPNVWFYRASKFLLRISRYHGNEASAPGCCCVELKTERVQPNKDFPTELNAIHPDVLFEFTRNKKYSV